tara:strand:+ start:831 stop:1067 length:237 start_codon:yes stop_codon:yes gene_type:complete
MNKENAMQDPIFSQPVWRVKVMRPVTYFGVVYIEADSSEVAVEKAIEMFGEEDVDKLITDQETGVVSVTNVERMEGDL